MKDPQTAKNKKIIEATKIIGYVVSVFITVFLIWKFVASPTVVDGSSMFPTLENGERLLVDKISYKTGSPKRFDLIVFEEEKSSTGYFIKRIIGLPGETVFIDKDSNIYINGEIIPDIYGFDDIKNRGLASGTITLADNEYFVLGDNRNNSEDSRFKDIGNIKREAIFGKVFIRLMPFSKFGYPDLYRERMELRKEKQKKAQDRIRRKLS